MGRIAKLLGAAAHLGCVALWCILLGADPYGEAGHSAGTYVVAVVMIGASLMGVWASATARPGLMAGLFVLAFFPVGFYLAGTPGWFSAIAWLNLTSLLAALLLARLRGAGTGESPGDHPHSSRDR